MIGWDAKQRKVDLTIERSFRGEELVMRMKGWVTVDVKKVTDIIKKYGYLKVLDDRDLVVECETEGSYQELEKDLLDHFKDQVHLEPLTSG